jgi:FecR protein
MGLANRLSARIVLAAAAVAVSASSALAQQPAGVVTSLEGTATVSRVALPEPRPLQFRDDVYVRDRIVTGERSLVRVLLGGKATVTARERSVLTITEAPGVSTISLDEGRIAVAVSKGLMKPGEVVEIKTPNAVSAIRGTVVIAEVSPGAAAQSTITVLRGLVDVTRLEAGRRVGHKVDVGALQAITVAGAAPLTRPSAIGAEAAKRLTSEFRVVPQGPPSAAAAPAVEVAMRHAKADAAGVSSTRNVAAKGGADASGKDSDLAGAGPERGESKDAKHKSDASNAVSMQYSGGDLVPLSAGGVGVLDTATSLKKTPRAK